MRRGSLGLRVRRVASARPSAEEVVAYLYGLNMILRPRTAECLSFCSGAAFHAKGPPPGAWGLKDPKSGIGRFRP